MKKSYMLAIWFSSTSLLLSAQNVQVKVHTDQPANQINKHIYGHFAEHLGRGVYDGLYVGAESKVPNTDGVRNDVIDALKDLKIPNLRWPGGCFADSYHWKDAIGPKDQRLATENMAWGNVREDNGFGTHEFLDLCEQLGAEAYLATNMNSGTVREAVDWVQYVNHANGTSYLTDLREENGRAIPWNVKFWGIGNESWDCGGNMDVDHYTDQYKQYATAMTSYSNTEGLFRVAVGPGWDDYHWTEEVMKQIPLKRMEGLSIHHYAVLEWSNKGSSYEFTDDQYFRTMKKAWFMDEFIIENSKIMDQYDPEKKVALVVDEWGGWYAPIPEKGQLYQQNTMRDAMIAGLTLNVFNNHSDRVRMANLAQTVNVLQAVILTEEEKMILTPTYYVMKMYAVHQDATLIPVSFVSPEYNMGEDQIPALSISASETGGKLSVSLVNMDLDKGYALELDLSGYEFDSVKGQIIESEDIRDHNSFDQSQKVITTEFKDFKSKKGSTIVNLPAFSVLMLQFE